MKKNLNPIVFGNLAHSILDKIYPHKILSVRDFKKNVEGIDLLIKDEMFKILGTKDLEVLIMQILKWLRELITKMLDYEMSLIKKGARKIEIIDTERKIDFEINTANNKLSFLQSLIELIDLKKILELLTTKQVG